MDFTSFVEEQQQKPHYLNPLQTWSSDFFDTILMKDSPLHSFRACTYLKRNIEIVFENSAHLGVLQ